MSQADQTQRLNDQLTALEHVRDQLYARCGDELETHRQRVGDGVGAKAHRAVLARIYREAIDVVVGDIADIRKQMIREGIEIDWQGILPNAA